MSRQRKFTDEECKSLADWYANRGTIYDKAKELDVSMGTLRDAILRGQGKDVGYMRRKISSYLATAHSERESQISEPPHPITWADTSGFAKPEHEWIEHRVKESA
jgi:hypothetical protein